MTDIITLGELLIDLTQRGSDENGNGEFTAYPGGAPANVAVAASRLGASAGFIGKVGDDAFGRSLADTLKKDNVDISGLFYDDYQPTTMAIVSVDDLLSGEVGQYASHLLRIVILCGQGREFGVLHSIGFVHGYDSLQKG